MRPKLCIFGIFLALMQRHGLKRGYIPKIVSSEETKLWVFLKEFLLLGNVNAQLKYTEKKISENPKSYSAWYHRKYVMSFYHYYLYTINQEDMDQYIGKKESQCISDIRNRNIPTAIFENTKNTELLDRMEAPTINSISIQYITKEYLIYNYQLTDEHIEELMENGILEKNTAFYQKSIFGLTRELINKSERGAPLHPAISGNHSLLFSGNLRSKDIRKTHKLKEKDQNTRGDLLNHGNILEYQYLISETVNITYKILLSNHLPGYFSALGRESELCRMLLEHDPRNFHCWNYIRYFDIFGMEEFSLKERALLKDTDFYHQIGTSRKDPGYKSSLCTKCTDTVASPASWLCENKLDPRNKESKVWKNNISSENYSSFHNIEYDSIAHIYTNPEDEAGWRHFVDFTNMFEKVLHLQNFTGEISFNEISIVCSLPTNTIDINRIYFESMNICLRNMSVPYGECIIRTSLATDVDGWKAKQANSYVGEGDFFPINEISLNGTRYRFQKQKLPEEIKNILYLDTENIYGNCMRLIYEGQQETLEILRRIDPVREKYYISLWKNYTGVFSLKNRKQ